MSLARRWMGPISVPVGDGAKMRRAHRFTCRKCGATHDVSANTFCGARAHDDLLKVMRRAGWELGPSAEKDICGGCAMRERVANRAKLKVVESKEPIMATNTGAAPAADPPREMSIDDALLIHERLSDVYVSKERGYSDGWTDKRLAEDMGVPRDWVRQIREKRFGPAADNEEIRAVAKEAEAVLAAARAQLAAMSELRAKCVQHAAALDGLRNKIVKEGDALSRAISGIEARLADIQKAVR